MDYGCALLGPPSGSRALAQRPHNALVLLLLLSLLRSSSVPRTETVYRPAIHIVTIKVASSSTKGKIFFYYVFSPLEADINRRPSSSYHQSNIITSLLTSRFSEITLSLSSTHDFFARHFEPNKPFFFTFSPYRADHTSHDHQLS